MHALQLETYQLTKRFGSFTAMDSVSLTVRPGTVHALLGENGAGKSTLVKAIVGYHRPDAGAVLVDGREYDISSPVVARDLGVVSRDVVPRSAESGGGWTVFGSGVWPTPVVVVHPGFQLSCPGV